MVVCVWFVFFQINQHLKAGVLVMDPYYYVFMARVVECFAYILIFSLDFSKIGTWHLQLQAFECAVNSVRRLPFSCVFSLWRCFNILGLLRLCLEISFEFPEEVLQVMLEFKRMSSHL